MFLGTLCPSLLGNLLPVKDTIRAGEGMIWAGEACHILQLILKYKDIIKMNLNLMVFIQEIIYL